MRLRTIGLIVLLLCGVSFAQTSAPAAPTTAPARNPAAASPKTGKSGERFMEMHQKFVDRGKQGDVDVLFLGDSITEGWSKAQDVFHANYDKYKPANFGIGGDRTEHVLWRIENGELDGIKPKVVVLLIGVNNAAGGDTPEGIAAGIKNIIGTVRDKTNAKLLLLGVFPWGEKPEDPKREKIKAINDIIAKYDDGKNVRYLDFGKSFLEDDSTMKKEIMGDFLHPSARGYTIWATEMAPLLDEMMK